MTIYNGQRHFVVTDPEVLAEIEDCLSTPVPDGKLEGGVSYHVTFKFKSHYSFTTYIHIYNDGRGFIIDDPTSSFFNDPMPVIRRFKEPMDERVRLLLEQLVKKADVSAQANRHEQ